MKTKIKNKKYWFLYEIVNCLECGKTMSLIKTKQFSKKPGDYYSRHIINNDWCWDCKRTICT